MTILFHVPEPAPGIFYDNFSGSNGDPPNPTNWSKIVDANDRITIQNNMLSFNSPLGTEEGRYRSNFYLQGDFDMQVDFAITTLTRAGGSTSSKIGIDIGFPAAYISAEWCHRANDFFWGNGYEIKTDNSSGAGVAKNDVVGKLRMRRVGSTYTFWYWDTGWVWNTNPAGFGWSGASTANAYALLYYTNGGGEVDCTFDNFIVNSGTIVWP